MISFEQTKNHPIPSLGAILQEYREPSTGARHIHLATDQSELAFLVGFPTVPDSSDGRAHILEHLALTGSERFPVRDPFFSMMRRSTAHFMNALTYADRTAYPFASTGTKDFFNLLDVYLDAAFFPRLDYLSFLQEGWRYTLDDGVLGLQGVVFNEMKGAFADPMHALYSGICRHLLAGTTYAVDSGGDPLQIPTLSYEAVKAFHANHYHPSQAVFMSAGPVASAEIQQVIIDKVLARFKEANKPLMPQLATVPAPRQARIEVPSQDAAQNEHGIQIAWIVGESSDPLAYYRANLLQAGLLGDAGAPLQKAMESAGFGRPSRLNGMDDNARQLMFHLGMEGLSEGQTGPAREIIWDALERAAETGISLAALQTALRDIKFKQRNTANGYTPNVLTRMLNALPVAMRGGAVLDVFDTDRVLGQLEQDIATPGYFQGLVRTLLGVPARLDATVVPDTAYFTRRAEQEQVYLANTAVALDDAARAQIVDDSAALMALQQLPSAVDRLPRTGIDDVSRHPRPLPEVPHARDGKHTFEIASNGVSYARVQFDLAGIPESDWPLVRLYADLRRDLGVGKQDYAAAEVWRNSMVPEFHVSFEAVLDQRGKLCPSLVFFCNALQEEQSNIAAVLQTYIDAPRFDEYDRIAFLVRRMVRQRVNDLAQSGSRLAALAAAAPLSPLRRFEDCTIGSAALPQLGQFERLVQTDEGVAKLAASLAAVHDSIRGAKVSMLCAGSAQVQALADTLQITTELKDASPAQVASTEAATRRSNSALLVPSQVNHCSIAWHAPLQDHPDGPALAVAAELMTNQLLHTALRERGGAYGGSASYASPAGVFMMSSYRDPRLAGTYADFTECFEEVLKRPFSQQQLEEAIICVVKALDRPLSPFDAAVAAWTLRARGIGPEERQQFRTGVLACSVDDIRNAVERWLKPGLASRAAFVGTAEQDLDGLDVIDLLALSKT